jgi:hypothetical protein
MVGNAELVLAAPIRVRKSRSFLAEYSLNNKLQMRASSTTEKVVTLTEQMKIGLCEQVRVNWQTGALNRSATSPVFSF